MSEMNFLLIKLCVTYALALLNIRYCCPVEDGVMAAVGLWDIPSGGVVSPQRRRGGGGQGEIMCEQ